MRLREGGARERTQPSTEGTLPEWGTEERTGSRDEWGGADTWAHTRFLDVGFITLLLTIHTGV